MTTTTVTADDIYTRLARYQDRFQLPCWASKGHIMTRMIDLTAITMPAALGEKVRERLHTLNMRGPIVGIRNSRWTFLARGETPLDQYSSLLLVDGACIVGAGASMMLPSPLTEQNGYCQWIEQPQDTLRPSAVAIVHAIDRVTGRNALATRYAQHYV